jgi:hypothetical protein
MIDMAQSPPELLDLSDFGESGLHHPLPPFPGADPSFDYSTDLGWFGGRGALPGTFNSPGDVDPRVSDGATHDARSAALHEEVIPDSVHDFTVNRLLHMNTSEPTAPRQSRPLDETHEEEEGSAAATNAVPAHKQQTRLRDMQRRAMAEFDQAESLRTALPRPRLQRSPPPAPGQPGRFVTQNELEEQALRLRVQSWARSLDLH